MNHFTIFRKDVGGRVEDIYFASWTNAQTYMQKDIIACIECGFTTEGIRQYFNSAKGFEEYYCKGKTKDGEKVLWCLLDGFFSDQLVMGK